MSTRRAFISLTSVAGLALVGCRKGAPKAPAGSGEIEVTAVEDLMREHGVLRRCLVLYRTTASRLRTSPDSVPPRALQKTATLFRTFGEEYHEKKLEEAYIFPRVKRAGGPAASYIDTLAMQHERGRAITEYVIAATQAPRFGAKAEQLATVLDGFARMYETHAAREDTVVFPAWTHTMSPHEYDAIGDQFEEIEHKEFGVDGFEDAVRQIAGIEAELDLGDIAAFTAPPPPKA
jgi:hemerythrin-like domain-containing protein